MISLVIPVFNEEDILPLLFRRLQEAQGTWGEQVEYIWVDDGSWDNSLVLLQSHVNQFPRQVLVRLSRNFGQQAAISAGLAHAQGDAVVIMDADLQDPPDLVQAFIDKWKEGYHVVYAVRTGRKEHVLKRISYRLFYKLLQSTSSFPIPLDAGDFCLMDQKVVQVIVHEFTEQNKFIRGLRAYAGFRHIGIPYARPGRHAGKPKYSIKKLLKLAFAGLLDFSHLPLRLAAILGGIIAFPSCILGILWLVGQFRGSGFFFAQGEESQGFIGIALALFFLAGIILIALGIIGEYLNRIYREVKSRPAYIVEEVTRNAP